MTGAALLRGFDPDTIARFVAPDPRAALDRIAARHGAEPSPRGLNLPIMADIRDYLAGRDPSGRLANGLKIVAPHSHWDKGLPILISRLGAHYVLDEQVPLAGNRYRPVSFALGGPQPLAYEWVDESVDMPDDQYHALIDTIVAVAKQFGERVRDLGLAIDYRFKHPFASDVIQSEEYPESDAPNAPAIVIRQGQHYLGLPDAGVETMEQVGWTARQTRGDLPDKITPVYDRVAQLLEGLDDTALAEIRRDL